jgi:uncharacterized protein (DUF305 family)
MTAIDTDGSENVDAGGVFDEEVEDRPRFEWTWPKVLLLVAAVAFLAAAATYFVTNRAEESAGPVDVGFLQDMIDHHDQAVELALLELANGTDPTARHFAQETIIFQRREIGIMETLLAQGGHPRGEVPRDVMAWMNMTTPLADMPGMASEQAMDALANASGADADRQFLELMRAHHQGGIHMADWAAEYGSNERVRALAAQIAEYQRIEVNEYTQLMQRLGYA